VTSTSTSTAATGPLIAAAIDRALRTVAGNIAPFGASFPGDTTTNGRYLPRPPAHGEPAGGNVGWTTSFWPGMLWLGYELTGDDAFRDAGEAQVGRFTDRIERRVELDTHDLGFLYTLSCVAPWRLRGNERARQTAIEAAEHLMVRFLEPAGILQAWGDLDDPAQRGRTIIDSLMNTPLLFWASEQTGDERLASAAHRHATQLRDHIVRADGSTFHTFFWDPVTGEPLRGATAQGHADGSCWARGQAWGIYGFALNHRGTGDASLLDAAIALADYFLTHLPSDHVPYWDLVFGDGSGEERDSSAGAIAACGLAQLAEQLGDDPRAERYRVASRQILDSLIESYVPADGMSDALLLHGVYDKPQGIGVDEGTLWGDYFFLEALTRAALPGRALYW
jgi:unsaturated chondroitin disaccharide hydrolase